MSKKIAKKTLGAAVVSTGYALKLAKWGLSVSEIVLNGAKNMADSFVKGPELGIGKAMFSGIKGQIGKTSDYLIKNGKKLCR